MEMKESFFNLSGHFKLQLLQNEKVLFEWEKHNAIIQPTIEKLAKSIMGLIPYEPNTNFVKIKLGDGGSNLDGSPIDITGNESDLNNSLVEYTHKGLPGVLYDDQGQSLVSYINAVELKQGLYKLTIIIDNTDGNSPNDVLREYSEVGLFFANDDMFAYRTFPRVSKDSSTNLKIEWTFQFLTNKGIQQP